MGIFSLWWQQVDLNLEFDYGEYILNRLLTSKFIKKKLGDILLAITANLIQMQVVTVLCYSVSINPVVDYCFQIGVSTVLAINIDYFYLAIQNYKPKFHQLARHLINNYSFDNYIYWKRLVTTGILGYALLVMSVVEINNRLIVIYLSQCFINFIIIDRYQAGVFHRLAENYLNTPIKRIHEKMPKEIIESYYPNREKHQYITHKSAIKNLDDLPKVYIAEISDSDESDVDDSDVDDSDVQKNSVLEKSILIDSQHH